MENFFNTSKQLKFILRRERIITPIWFACLILTVIASAVAYKEMFQNPEELGAMLGMMENPVMVAMLGPVYGIENLTAASLFACEMLLFTVIAVAIMNIFFILRYTRGDEEKGRTELIRSLPTGRLSSLAAACLGGVVLNLSLALLFMLTLALCALPGATAGGIIVFSLSVGFSGLFFAALTAVFAQLSATSRGGMILSLSTLGVLYLVRAVGDISSEVLSLLSPLGLILRTQSFTSNKVWPLLIILVLTAVLGAYAFYLTSRRDLGRGLIDEKAGKTEASPFLKTHEGLAVTLLRGTFIAWAVSMFLFGAIYGAVINEMETFLDNNEMLKELLVPPEGHTITELFISMIFSMFAIIASIPSMGAVLRLVNEEKQHRMENVLSKAISRHRVMTVYVAAGFVQSVIILFLGMLGMYLAAAATMDDPIAFSSMFSSVMIYVFALWAMVSIAALLSAALPKKASGITYGYLGFTFFLSYIGEMANFPDFSKYFTPFGYIPKIPMETLNPLTPILLTLFAAILTTLSYIFYRKRDLT